MRSLVAMSALLAVLAITAPSAEASESLSPAWQRAIAAADATYPKARERCPHIAVLFTNGGRPDDGWVGWGATAPRCEVGARPWLRDALYVDICPVVVHEWGHVAGLGHSADRASPMHPESGWADACGEPPEARELRLNNLDVAIIDRANLRWGARRRCRGAGRYARCARRALRRLRAGTCRLIAERRRVAEALVADGMAAPAQVARALHPPTSCGP